MTEQEVVKQSAELLKRVIRGIDKKLEYHFVDSAQEGRFSLKLTTRGKSTVISLVTGDLRAALQDDVRKKRDPPEDQERSRSLVVDVRRRRHGDEDDADAQAIRGRQGRHEVVVFLPTPLGKKVTGDSSPLRPWRSHQRSSVFLWRSPCR
jgi:hypothetical protein